MPGRWQGYVNYYMPEPHCGSLPKCLLICSCAVQLMGLGKSPLRKHSGSLAAPHVPNNCFYMSAGGKKLTSPSPATMMGFRQNVTREILYQTWLWAVLFVGNLFVVVFFINFLLKFLNAALKSWIPHTQILDLSYCFPLVLNFKLLRIISLLFKNVFFSCSNGFL